MSNTQDLYRLLKDRNGQWVNRADLNFVGGMDTGRRMRELNEQINGAGYERLESREGAERALEYRLVALSPAEVGAESERRQWECCTCTSYPSSMASLQPSMDPRWKIGPCRACKTKKATFRHVS